MSGPLRQWRTSPSAPKTPTNYRPSPLAVPGNVLAASTSSSTLSVRTSLSSATTGFARRSHRSDASSAHSNGRLSKTAAAFEDVDPVDFDFLDKVIADVQPSDGAELGQLRQAFDRTLQRSLLALKRNRGERWSESEANEEAAELESRLWPLCMALAKDRRRSSWKERWDAVRVVVGLEPRSSDDEHSATTEPSSDDVDHEEETGGSSGEDGRDHRHVRGQDAASEDEESHAGRQRQADLSDRLRNLRLHPQANRPLGSGATISQSREYLIRDRQDRRARQDREDETRSMADSASSASESIDLSNLSLEDDNRAMRSSLSPTPPPYEEDVTLGARAPLRWARDKSPSAHLTPKQPLRAFPLGTASPSTPRDSGNRSNNDLLASEQQDPQPQRSFKRKTPHPPSPSPPQQRQAQPQRQLPHQHASPRGPALQRFNEVITASRASQEQARLARDAESAEREQRELANASHAYSLRLKSRLFTLWHERARKYQQQAAAAERAHRRVLLARVLALWSTAARRRSKQARLAAKADGVRIKLSAWRRMRRIAKARAEAKAEERRETLRGTYRVVKQKRNAALLRIALGRWRERTREQRALTFDQTRLCLGAFSLWKLRAAQKHVMDVREDRFVQQREARIVSAAWEAWITRFDLQQLHTSFAPQVDKRVVQTAFTAWRRAAMHNSLAEAFTRHRLLRSCLHAWVDARATQAHLHKLEGVVERRSARKTLASVFALWHERAAVLQEKEQQADELRRRFENQRARAALRAWRLHARQTARERQRAAEQAAVVLARWRSRCALMRVEAERKLQLARECHKTHVLASHFRAWLDDARRKQERYDTIAMAADGRLAQVHLQQWVARARAVRRMQDVAEERDRQRLKQAVFIAWKDGMLERRSHRLKAQKDRRYLQAAFEGE